MPQKIKNELGEYRSVLLDSDIFDIEHEKYQTGSGKWKVRPTYSLNLTKLGTILAMHHDEIDRLNIEIKRLQKELKRLGRPRLEEV